MFVYYNEATGLLHWTSLDVPLGEPILVTDPSRWTYRTFENHVEVTERLRVHFDGVKSPYGVFRFSTVYHAKRSGQLDRLDRQHWHTIAEKGPPEQVELGEFLFETLLGGVRRRGGSGSEP